MKLMKSLRQRRLSRQAAEWITTLDRGDLKDEVQFNIWWSRSWHHMKAAMDMAAIDDEMTRALKRMAEEPGDASKRGLEGVGRVGGFGSLGGVASLGGVGSSSGLRGLRRRRDPRGSSGSGGSGTSSGPRRFKGSGNLDASGFRAFGLRWKPATIAAAVVVIAAVAAITIAYRLLPSATEYEAGIGELRVVRMADGTSIHINTRSRVAVRFTEDARSVRLIEGEALFDVGKDPRPFEVRSGTARIRDIGTRFNVRLSNEAVDVAVLAGAVQVNAAKATAVALHPGETAHIETANGAAPVRTAKAPIAELEQRLSWTRGLLTFSEQPLYDVVAEVNRYNSQQLSVADPVTGNMRVGGSFRANDLKSLLRGFDKLGIRNERAGTRGEQPTIVLRADPARVQLQAR